MDNKDRLYFELAKLNPDVQFSRDRVERKVISSASMDKVKLPEGFYYENGMITNGAENYEDRISMPIEVRVNNAHLVERLYFELAKLNPDIQFSRDRVERRVISSAPMDKVKLPEGFYYENGMITNGAENYEDRISMPIEVRVNNAHLAERLYFELVKLNPDIQFSRDRVERRVISSAPMDKVKLPEGFYYENGMITNGAENYEDRISISIVSQYQNEVSEEETKKENFLKERNKQRQHDSVERDKQLKNRLNFISKLISNFSNNQSTGGKAK